MTLPGEGNTGGLSAQVDRLLDAADNLIQRHGGPVLAGILATAAVFGTPAAAAASTESMGHAKSPVTHTGINPSAHKPSITGRKAECSSTGHMFGHDKQQRIMNYFVICQGDSVAQAAGVVGNLVQESDLQPEEVESGGFSRHPADAGSGGWGIAQWTPGSRATSESRKYGIKGPLYTLQPQLALVAAEMRGESPTGQHNMLRKLKQTKDPGHAAERFEQDFEEGSIAASGGGQLSKRQKYAREIAHECGTAAVKALRYFQGHKKQAIHS